MGSPVGQRGEGCGSSTDRHPRLRHGGMAIVKEALPLLFAQEGCSKGDVDAQDDQNPYPGEGAAAALACKLAFPLTSKIPQFRGPTVKKQNGQPPENPPPSPSYLRPLGGDFLLGGPSPLRGGGSGLPLLPGLRLKLRSVLRRRTGEMLRWRLGSTPDLGSSRGRTLPEINAGRRVGRMPLPITPPPPGNGGGAASTGSSGGGAVPLPSSAPSSASSHMPGGGADGGGAAAGMAAAAAVAPLGAVAARAEAGAEEEAILAPRSMESKGGFLAFFSASSFFLFIIS